MKAISYLSEDDLRQIQLLADDLERSQIEAALLTLRPTPGQTESTNRLARARHSNGAT